MAVIPNAKKITLESGLRLLVEEIPSMRSVSMGILVGAGSGNETPKEAGISHFIEHMTFKGTKKRSAFEIAHALDAVGGKMNAFTSKEMTVYYAVVLDKHLDIALDVLSDIFLNSNFDPKEMETEKGVVLEEVKMYEDTPDELIHDLFLEKILPDHPLGRPTIGRVETIKAIKQEDILSYRKRLYTPENVIISLAGAIPSNLTDLIQPYFNGFSGRVTSPPLPPGKLKSGIHLKQKKTEQVHLCLGAKGPSQVDENRYPFAILDDILGGSMSSRLFQEVREKRGLVYSIFSTSSPFRDFGVSYTYAGTSKENLEQVVELVLNQFRQLKKEGITAAELEKGKEYLKGTMVLGLESTSSRMSWLAKTEFYYGRVITVDEIFAKVDKVTRDDIIELANLYLQDDCLTLAVIGDFDKLPIKEIKC